MNETFGITKANPQNLAKYRHSIDLPTAFIPKIGHYIFQIDAIFFEFPAFTSQSMPIYHQEHPSFGKIQRNCGGAACIRTSCGDALSWHGAHFDERYRRTCYRELRPSQNRLERAAQGFVPEHESAAQRLVRDDALAAEQKFVGEIAGQVMQQRGRDAEYRGPL
jgi:hypothetical protein